MAVEILYESEGKLDCQTCDDKLKEERGHDKDGIIPFLIDGKRVFRCPLMMITPLSWEYIKAFSFYEKAILPGGQGWGNQSAKYINAMMVLGNQFNKFRNNESKKVNKNARSRT